MDAKILVVGTTPDYVDLIWKISGKRVLFLTDTVFRTNTTEEVLLCNAEVFADLANIEQAISTLKQHLSQFSLILSGVACFDCESMELASRIAALFSLQYPSLEAIRNSRDKFCSKRVWSKAGLKVPKYKILYTEVEAFSFFKEINSPCVLKPLSGAGSELVFCCYTEKEVKERFNQIFEGLKIRQTNRLFKTEKYAVLAEEFIEGTEYSCDFIIDDNTVDIIRLTEKIKSDTLPFGIIAGYKLIHSIQNITHERLISTLVKSANSIGITRAICMIDFIVKDGEMCFIEIAPRPGGDCLPALLSAATNQNILKMSIDFAEGVKPKLIDYRGINELLALRIFAPYEGKLVK